MGIIEGFAIEGFFRDWKSEEKGSKGNKVTVNENIYQTIPFISGFSFGPSGIGHLIGIAITILALYFYFKCNWTKKGKFSVNASNVSDKIVGFLVSCCCSICYVAYHLAIPC